MNYIQASEINKKILEEIRLGGPNRIDFRYLRAAGTRVKGTVVIPPGTKGLTLIGLDIEAPDDGGPCISTGHVDRWHNSWDKADRLRFEAGVYFEGCETLVATDPEQWPYYQDAGYLMLQSSATDNKAQVHGELVKVKSADGKTFNLEGGLNRRWQSVKPGTFYAYKLLQPPVVDLELGDINCYGLGVKTLVCVNLTFVYGLSIVGLSAQDWLTSGLQIDCCADVWASKIKTSDGGLLPFPGNKGPHGYGVSVNCTVDGYFDDIEGVDVQMPITIANGSSDITVTGVTGLKTLTSCDVHGQDCYKVRVSDVEMPDADLSIGNLSHIGGVRDYFAKDCNVKNVILAGSCRDVRLDASIKCQNVILQKGTPDKGLAEMDIDGKTVAGVPEVPLMGRKFNLIK